MNAAVMFTVLGLDPQVDGLTLVDARRAAIRAGARRDLAEFARADEVLHGERRELEDGVIELRPVRGWSRGLGQDDIRERAEAFAEFVEEVARRGGTRLWWG